MDPPRAPRAGAGRAGAAALGGGAAAVAGAAADAGVVEDAAAEGVGVAPFRGTARVAPVGAGAVRSGMPCIVTGGT